jgi:hypothetical protein
METSDSSAMSAKIVAAIAAVMGKVPKLAKGERNTHANYNFASIDDFLEAVRPLMADAGLVIASDEDSFEVLDGGWLKMRFAFSVHCGGDSYGPLRRSIMTQSKMGSQSFGAAQSYAEKQFLRSLFKIATGEGDADSHAQVPLTRTSSSPPRDTDRITPKQVEALQKLADEVGADVRKFCAYAKITVLGDIRAADFDRAVETLEAKRKQAA